MTVIPKAYVLKQLPEEARRNLLSLRLLENRDEYRAAMHLRSGAQDGLLMAVSAGPPARVTNAGLIWATTAPSGAGKHKFDDVIQEAATDFIQPRVEKSKEEQKARVKQRAEVFTPSWVCNLQNNLIDDEVLYPGAFNVTDGPASKTWIPTAEPVKFSEDYTWAHYVTENRLEMTCGEGPYLFSRYDTVTGAYLPVRDEESRWVRIGLLDRKLRVVSERGFTSEAEWREASLHALRSIFGFEWQGDNLLLARLNGLNTMVDYYRDTWGSLPPESYLISVSEVLSWNLWQMDGLKSVVPESCTATCGACEQKSRAGHEGRVALVRFGSKVKPFEELLPSNFFPKASRPKIAKTPAPKVSSRPTGPGLFGDMG